MNKKSELIGQAVLYLIEFLCDYLGLGQPGMNEQSPLTNATSRRGNYIRMNTESACVWEEKF